MSKRFIYRQQLGERKKVKLDVTISDHNFPLSQNPGLSKDRVESWGDDKDDEILLMATQACEDVYSTSDMDTLPDYSICMKPSSTSTQLNEENPTTSKTPYLFKKPNSVNKTNELKSIFSHISSPLPTTAYNLEPTHNEEVTITDDLIFNDKIIKNQDANSIYRQLLQLQEDNAKLKSENGKLLEKCVTKEGEASILRTQLKTCQASVDNARLERLKAQETIQMEWTDKLNAVNQQMHDLRTQLDFKNLEIISIKERCKMIESSKIKLTQVTVAGSDISSSHKLNNVHESLITPMRKPKMTSTCIQTENKNQLLISNIILRREISKLNFILPLILEDSTDQTSILECNEKLQNGSDLLQNKCRVFSTFHRIPVTTRSTKSKISVRCIYDDLIRIVAENDESDILQQEYVNIINVTKQAFNEVQNELERILERLSTAFQKEMNERYIEATNEYLVVEKHDLLQGKALYKDEQGILLRRLTITMVYVIENSKPFANHLKEFIDDLILVISKICSLLDSTVCAILYSGLLLSVINILESILTNANDARYFDIIKCIIVCRPMSFVTIKLLALLRRFALFGRFWELCLKNSQGNLKLDYDQGVLLYKKDTCLVQVVMKQVEAALKCIERQNYVHVAMNTTKNLVAIYSNSGICHLAVQDKLCNCQIVLMQVIVYSLRICAVMLKNTLHSNDTGIELLAICRSGVQVLYRCMSRNVEFGLHLSYNEGHLIEFCEILRSYEHSEIYNNMLSELAATFQAVTEETTPYFQKQAWLTSFQTFSIID